MLCGSLARQLHLMRCTTRPGQPGVLLSACWPAFLLQGQHGSTTGGAPGVQRAQARLQRAALQSQVPRGLRHQLLDALLVTLAQHAGAPCCMRWL
jgi:hypothetical protein